MKIDVHFISQMSNPNSFNAALVDELDCPECGDRIKSGSSRVQAFDYNREDLFLGTFCGHYCANDFITGLELDLLPVRIKPDSREPRKLVKIFIGRGLAWLLDKKQVREFFPAGPGRYSLTACEAFLNIVCPEGLAEGTEQDKWMII